MVSRPRAYPRASDVFALLTERPAGAVDTVTRLYHFDGTRWTDMAIDGASRVEKLWGLDPTNVLAVGAGGEVQRYRSGRWSAVAWESCGGSSGSS